MSDITLAVGDGARRMTYAELDLSSPGTGDWPRSPMVRGSRHARLVSRIYPLNKRRLLSRRLFHRQLRRFVLDHFWQRMAKQHVFVGYTLALAALAVYFLDPFQLLPAHHSRHFD
jgi:hypothetical protein